MQPPRYEGRGECEARCVGQSRLCRWSRVLILVSSDSAVDVALKYNTASSSGAILYLPTKSARRREVLRDSTIMHDYLQKNYKAWHHHLHHHNKLKVNKKDLLFVRGYVKTARWAVAALVSGLMIWDRESRGLRPY